MSSQVEVSPSFVPEESRPDEGIYFFSYLVKIHNKGPRPATLKQRKWIITDAWGRVEIIEGPGVVGQQPRLNPGEVFEYNSFCPLPTATGSMKRHYQMSHDDGTEFKVEIPEFFLVEPNHYN